MFDIDTLNEYKERGLITGRPHDELDLIIWNYTPKVQYDRLWDEVTLNCRGLITNTNGKVVARGFKKFFNIEENKHTPTDSFEVQEKLDGSLGIIFFYNDKWHVATRGSFNSDQAKRASKMLDNSVSTTLNIEHTYLVEIIYPENRIVVDYGNVEKLVWLTTMTKDGKEVDYCPFYLNAKVYEGVDYKNIQELNWKNEEGFVVKFSNGDRCKIKFEDYVRLHKIVTQTSAHTIWDVLRVGGSLDEIINNVPDEFYDWVRNVSGELYESFNEITGWSYSAYREALESTNSRKEFAEKAKEYKYPQLLFGYYDHKDVDKMIWKILEPSKNDKPFKND